MLNHVLITVHNLNMFTGLTSVKILYGQWFICDFKAILGKLPAYSCKVLCPIPKLECTPVGYSLNLTKPSFHTLIAPWPCNNPQDQLLLEPPLQIVVDKLLSKYLNVD